MTKERFVRRMEAGSSSKWMEMKQQIFRIDWSEQETAYENVAKNVLYDITNGDSRGFMPKAE